ncbi:MAG: pyridoxamine 5'-phosphate oxidase family protein [Clostridiales Family XIII bacterium]|jgi:general stress protein 26|nr:pyridoxamine 5'-phosphate oxidase family protein [Clostridiales Family XIII bacterium]
MKYEEAIIKVFQSLGECKIMALGSSLNDHVTVRSVSCVFRDNRIFFKTDKEFPKTKQLLANPNVALCHWGVQIEGTAKNHGLVAEEPGQVFAKLYEKHWDKSYTSRPHPDSEILVEVIPKFIEVWDQDENDNGFQTLIDCVERTVDIVMYD